MAEPHQQNMLQAPPRLKASTDQSPDVAIHLPAKQGAPQVTGLGFGKGENTSKVPKRVPADVAGITRHRTFYYEKTPTDFHQVVPSFGN